MLRGGDRRKKRKNTVVEKVRWLGVILDKHLNFKEHWKHQIGKARSLLGALGGVGKSRWGMNPLSRKAAYMRMIQSVTSWGMEMGWRGSKEWRQEMTLLQNAVLQKTLGAVKVSSGDKVNTIAAV